MVLGFKRLTISVLNIYLFQVIMLIKAMEASVVIVADTRNDILNFNNKKLRNFSIKNQVLIEN